MRKEYSHIYSMCFTQPGRRSGHAGLLTFCLADTCSRPVLGGSFDVARYWPLPQQAAKAAAWPDTRCEKIEASAPLFAAAFAPGAVRLDARVFQISAFTLLALRRWPRHQRPNPSTRASRLRRPAGRPRDRSDNKGARNRTPVSSSASPRAESCCPRHWPLRPWWPPTSCCPSCP